MEYILAMTFLTSGGLKSTLSINGVKPAITQDMINSLMDTIISKNIFIASSSTLVKKESAQVTERKITKFELA